MATNVVNRSPLRDAQSRGNIGTPPPARPPHNKHKSALSASSAPIPPHHDSLMPNAHMNFRATTGQTSQHQQSGSFHDSKRTSQISSTSTNAEVHGRRRKTHIGPWELGADVGKGGCGKVRKVRHNVTGEQAAAKIISKRVAEKARAESLASLVENSRRPNAGALALGANIIPFGIEREVVIMKLLNHPNVVQLYDVWENRNELYLIMELVKGGELFAFIEERDYVDEDEAVFLFRQMVAALLHCHRLGIHHRDLKPENILLEQPSLRVKLVDFGMAALQPKGKLLTTPCGSIHYAAPEVFEKSYDGSKVDVWSLGIILYVMLTGTTPFVYDTSTMSDRVGLWYEVIKAGRFPIPDAFSDEAADLIKRMLDPDPKTRIILEDVWHHPFIHKYEAEWGETPEDGDIEKWIGTAPIIDNWDVKKSSDIDRELLRNLRTLWHSEKESVIVKRLLSEEPNQEKYFYSALQRHREEQLENYLANVEPETVSQSVNDRHHAKRDPSPQELSALRSTRSQFSILNNEHLSRNTLPERPDSSASYDPYRASRGHSVRDEKNDNYLSVTVHGQNSRQSLGRSVAGTIRRPASRIEALKSQHRRPSSVASSVSLRPASLAPSHTSSRQSMSRYSRKSTSRTSLTKPGFVKSNVYKRGVEFNHVRKSSTLNAMVTTPLPRSRSQSPKKLRQMSSPNVNMPSSPPAGSIAIRSRKEGRRPLLPPPRKQRTDSQIIATEARQVSTELERFCEEAFFRDSAATSERTSSTTNAPYDTPPSSLSNRGSFKASKPAPSQMTPAQNARPRPAAETPNTFIARELLETRRRLADKYASTESNQGAAYHEVMAHLDSLLQPGNCFAADGRRAPSDGRAFDHLPVISEEGRSDADDMRSSQDRQGGLSYMRGSSHEQANTIRMVAHSSPPQIKPLVIRKNSSESGDSRRSEEQDVRQSQATRPPNYATRKPTPTTTLVLGTIAEEAASPTTSHHTQTKKENWFKRRFAGRAVSDASRERSWEDLDDRQQPKQILGWSRAKRSPASGMLSPSSQGNSQNFSNALHGKRPGFLKFFTRKRRPAEEMSTDQEGHTSSSSTLTLSATHRNESSQSRLDHTLDPSEFAEPPDLGLSQSWLARFLNIKPATKTLCFSVGRGQARQILVRLLRGWKKEGIRDIVLDRERNLIFARLDRSNRLKLRECSFVIELYVMLARGRKANLSICRFTQRKGAASSFRTIVEEVENVLKQRNVLVKDEGIRREMESVLVSV